MVGDDEGCIQPGNVSPPSVASHSSSWDDVSRADVGDFPASCSPPEISRFEDHIEPLQPNDFLQGSIDPNPIPSRSTATLSSSCPDWRDPAELGPYGEFRPFAATSSLGQYSTFSASDGSYTHLEYVPLSSHTIGPQNGPFYSTAQNVIPELSSSGPYLDAASSDFNLITNDYLTNQTSSERDSSNNSLHCSFCGKDFAQRHLYNKHIKFHTRPLQCPKCPQRFATNRDMSRHTAVAHHQPSEVYHCEVPNCKYGKQSLGESMSFARKDNCRRHMRTAHGRTSYSER